MAKLLKQSQTYRVDSEWEVDEFIAEQKSTHEVTGWSAKHKLTKEDDYYIVKVDTLHGFEKDD